MMHTTVDAEINTDGTVELLEPLRVSKKTRALVTILEEAKDSEPKGSVSSLLAALEKKPLSRTRTVEEIDEHVRSVRQMRDEWDQS